MTDKKQSRPLTGQSLKAYEKAQQALCDAWRYPEGTPVTVRKDGGYALERVRPITP